MDIEKIKNELKDNDVDAVKEDAKNATLVWLKDKVLPAAKEVAETYTAALRESAGNETGWNKFRDTVFLPTLLDGAFWLFDKALKKLIRHGTLTVIDRLTPALNGMSGEVSTLFTQDTVADIVAASGAFSSVRTCGSVPS